MQAIVPKLRDRKCAETWHFLVRSRQLADSLQIFKPTAKAVKGKEGLFQLFVPFQASGMGHRAGSNSPRRTVGTLGMANTRGRSVSKDQDVFPTTGRRNMGLVKVDGNGCRYSGLSEPIYGLLIKNFFLRFYV